jgi:hypothetical protein
MGKKCNEKTISTLNFTMRGEENELENEGVTNAQVHHLCSKNMLS